MTASINSVTPSGPMLFPVRCIIFNPQPHLTTCARALAPSSPILFPARYSVCNLQHPPLVDVDKIADARAMQPWSPMSLNPKSRDVKAACVDIPDANVATPSLRRLLYPSFSTDNDEFCSKASLISVASVGLRSRCDKSIYSSK